MDEVRIVENDMNTSFKQKDFTGLAYGPQDKAEMAENSEKLLELVQAEPNAGIKMENWKDGMALNKESKKEDSDYSTAIHKQENASSKGDNQHFSVVLSPITLPKVFKKDFEQFIGAYKRFQETKKLGKPTFSRAEMNVDRNHGVSCLANKLSTVPF